MLIHTQQVGRKMRRLLVNLILLLAVMLCSGCDYVIRCDKTEYGYHAVIKTDYFSRDDLHKLQSLLVSNGFLELGQEREAIGRGYQGDFYKFFQKKINDRAFYSVDVLIFYVKSSQNDEMSHLEISVGNIYRGNVIAEIKEEIERHSRLIYDYLNKSIKGNIKIEKKTETPPMCL